MAPFFRGELAKKWEKSDGSRRIFTPFETEGSVDGDAPQTNPIYNKEEII